MNRALRISDLFDSGKLTVSVEFFPPKDDVGGERILTTATTLRESARPDFVSITYGAGGSTRERTLAYARKLKEEFSFDVMPHLTCVGSSKEDLRQILQSYREAGFFNIMALRGDPPKGQDTFQPHPEGLFSAKELVTLIKSEFPEFCIGVAGYPEVHPEAASVEEDLRHLKAKVEAGASFVTTQLFYDNSEFLKWYQLCREVGIKVPVVPGLMPIRSTTQAQRFAKHIPSELENRLKAASNDEQKISEVGAQWTVQQITELMEHGIHAFHLYIMNRAEPALKVMRELTAQGYLSFAAPTRSRS
jgi:methylenetetrahydrofolate reductase (NADPH)